jgi:hypothetical protein
MMAQQTIPSYLEQKASQFQGDGLGDMALGLGFLAAAWIMSSDWLPSLAFIWVILLMQGVKAAKKWLTVPRISMVDFTPPVGFEHRRKLFKTSLWILAGLLLLLGLLVFTQIAKWPPAFQAWLDSGATGLWAGIGILVVVLLALAGWVVGAVRWMVYAGLAVLGWLATVWLGIGFLVFLAALGALILAIGTVILVRFLQEYPLSGV